LRESFDRDTQGTFMARRNSDPPSGGDKAKVRVLFAEVEGNNESVQEALRTMVSAMNRSARVEHKVNGRPAPLLQQTDLPEEVEELIDQVADDAAMDDGPASAPPRKPRGSGKKVDRNSGLGLVPNLNFMPAGKQPVKDFIAEKDPKTDMESTLVLLFYMQRMMALTKIGPPHVMTAFKEAGKAIPVDVRQTIRNAHYKKMWLTFDDIEDLATTTQGDNFVEHEMVKRKSE
jgi:hypothetical protein